MKKFDLVYIKSLKHRGFIVKISNDEYTIYDCEDKININCKENDIEQLYTFEGVLHLFEQSLTSVKA